MYIYFCITKRHYFVNLTSCLRPNQFPLNVEITNENGIASPKHSHDTIGHKTNPFPRKPTETRKYSIMLGGGGGGGGVGGLRLFKHVCLCPCSLLWALFCSIPNFQMIYKVLPIAGKGNCYFYFILQIFLALCLQQSLHQRNKGTGRSYIFR